MPLDRLLRLFLLNHTLAQGSNVKKYNFNNVFNSSETSSYYKR